MLDKLRYLRRRNRQAVLDETVRLVERGLLSLDNGLHRYETIVGAAVFMRSPDYITELCDAVFCHAARVMGIFDDE